MRMRGRDLDTWSAYRPDSEEERNFVGVARRRVKGLIAMLHYAPMSTISDVLTSAYLQGAHDMLQCTLPHIRLDPKPHIKLKAAIL